MGNRNVSLSQELLERIERNKNLGQPWKINVSRVCQEALEKELNRIERSHGKYIKLKEVTADLDTAVLRALDTTILKALIKDREGENDEQA